MKQLRKYSKILVITLMLSLLSPSILPINNTVVAEAATVKLSKKTLTLEVGKAKTLKISGTKKKVTWKSSDKTVATVNQSGKVTAKKAGKATITATVNKTKYTCKVTVTKPVNPYVEDAPYKAKEVELGGIINGVIPEEFTFFLVTNENGQTVTAIYPSTPNMEEDTSYIGVIVQKTNTEIPDYSLAKLVYEELFTKDFIKSLLADQGMEAEIEDLKTSDYEVPLGMAFKIEYKANVTVNESSVSMLQEMYSLYIDDYLIQVIVTDGGEEITPSLDEVAEYFLTSLQIIK